MIGDDLAVLDQLDAPGLAEERGDRRGEERLAVAEADDERALEPRADEQARVVAVADDEREVALELAVRRADGLDEVAMVVALDEVGDRLRVRLGGEDVAVGLERLLQLAVVLDDAVEDDRDLLVGRAGQRMGVLEADAAVRRPARVADARRGQGAVRVRLHAQVAEVADRSERLEVVTLEQAETGRVVAAVLEALEALHQQVLRTSFADVSDDPAHPKLPSPSLRPSGHFGKTVSEPQA